MSISPSKYSWLATAVYFIDHFLPWIQGEQMLIHTIIQLYYPVIFRYPPYQIYAISVTDFYTIKQALRLWHSYKFSFYPKTMLDCNDFPASVANSV